MWFFHTDSERHIEMLPAVFCFCCDCDIMALVSIIIPMNEGVFNLSSLFGGYKLYYKQGSNHKNNSDRQANPYILNKTGYHI